MNRILIIGCGDIGRRVARLYLEQGAKVHGLLRSPEKAERLALVGVTPIPANLDDPESLRHLPAAGAVVFYFAPPPGGGFSDPRVKNFCTAIEGQRPEKVIYLSTSGVYGDAGGDEVTEDTPACPATSRGRRRLDAENTLRAWCGERSIPLVILRVTGIYGPGRLPVSQLAAGQPLLREEEAGLTNRIHADDLARICLAAAERGDDGEIFNVSDGHPTTMTHYFQEAAKLLGYPPPRLVSLEQAREEMAPLMFSYMTESRRMSNTRMLQRLGIRLRYPDLAAGLPSCLDGKD